MQGNFEVSGVKTVLNLWLDNRDKYSGRTFHEHPKLFFSLYTWVIGTLFRQSPSTVKLNAEAYVVSN
jgi:hypothetical protein